METFIADGYMDGSSEALFFEPIKKQKLKTMEASNKTVKLTTSERKVSWTTQYTHHIFLYSLKVH